MFVKKFKNWLSETAIVKVFKVSFSQKTNWGMSYSETMAAIENSKPKSYSGDPLNVMTFEYVYSWTGARFVKERNPEIIGAIRKETSHYAIGDIIKQIVPGTAYEYDINLGRNVVSGRSKNELAS